ncbi:MAG: DUF3592 domain-containing protein [Planctomycetaceae bacterium]
MRNEQTLRRAQKLKTLGLFIIVLGLFGSVGLYFDRTDAKAKHDMVRSWPTVDGKVVRNDVEKHQSFARIRGVPTRGATYEHTLAVVYEANGKTYRREYKERYDLSRSAYRAQAKQTQGATVAVHFNPAKPHQAEVLDTPEPPAAAFIGGGFIALIGVALFWFSHRQVLAVESEADRLQVQQTVSSRHSELAAVNLESAKYYFRQAQQ